MENQPKPKEIDDMTLERYGDANFEVPHKGLFKSTENLNLCLLEEKKKIIRNETTVRTFFRRAVTKITEQQRRKKTVAVSELGTTNFAQLHNMCKDDELYNLLENRVQQFSDKEFIYLEYELPATSEFFTPYKLIEVPFDKISRSTYFTLSKFGVGYWGPYESFFTDLDQWKYEYLQFTFLKKLKTFSLFRLWKGFITWRINIKFIKYNSAREKIKDTLIFANFHLANAILDLQEDLNQLVHLNFYDVSVIENWNIFYLYEKHIKISMDKMKILKTFLDGFSQKVYDACLSAIIDRGFYPRDEVELFPSLRKMREAMTSMDKARKRSFCEVLANFITVCDYLIQDCFAKIVKNSFERLTTGLEVQAALATDTPIEQRPSDVPQLPLFNACLILRPESIDIDPPLEVMTLVLRKIIGLCLDPVLEIRSLTENSKYNQFTEPMIMGRQEDRLARKPPTLNFLLSIDDRFNRNKEILIIDIERQYELAENYVKKFENIRMNYHEDVTTDPKIITSCTDLEALRNYCLRYHNNMIILDDITYEVDMGMLKIEQTNFKKIVTPVCKNLLSVLDYHLPKIAINKTEDIATRARVIWNKVNAIPKGTKAIVNYIKYLDEIESKITEFFPQVDYAHDCFMIIKEFDIFVDDAEREKYLDMEDLVLDLKDVHKEKKGEFDLNVRKIDECINEDFIEIFVDIEAVANDVANRDFLDVNSNRDLMIQTLDGIELEVRVLVDKITELQGYQKKFKLNITSTQTLDAAIQELRLKQNLWNTWREWDYYLKQWIAADFFTLNMEEIVNINGKVVRNCNLLIKNLEENDIVKLLQTSAEAFKEKIPVLSYLRNPTLKPRHWADIEKLLNEKFYLKENIKIESFDAVGAFSEENAQILLEISQQASGEAQLEAQLRAIEMIWKEVELLIVPHKGAKDVFIIADVDELQQVLDESIVNINTIYASKYVMPVLGRVREWLTKLLQFSDTLDEWMDCQLQWIYLEAIFGSPDIQRQLPQEAKLFSYVDRSFKDAMRNARKISLAFPVMSEPKYYKIMKDNNKNLDIISKGLEAYLEVKRMVFPRFYFLSNDELLEILAQTRNPQSVQPHLRKCFDAIYRLEFGIKESSETGGPVETNDIIAMLSVEGERLTFGKGLKARGPVEDWLSKVEEAMCISVKRYMKFGYQCYPAKPRHEWFQDHPNQVVLSVSQQQWAVEVHKILETADKKLSMEMMKAFEAVGFEGLAIFAAITRKNITSLLRKILCALITVDVHAKDSITSLVNNKVITINDFGWLKMLRFYWDKNTEIMRAKMATSDMPYYHEYLGAGGVLVLTPLTDRCYLCLMGALQMNLGGAPAGPAGTGKTETTKDLSKTVAKQCVVFNCSDSIDVKMMGQFFSGLAQCGAWCCFDEFNRIDIEVLSVIAQQLITIRNAKSQGLRRFMFEGREIRLEMACAAFITMNPGYAGRTELPDNLKALFRPISMMVPDYGLIAEVILYSEGFEDPKDLAHKMVQLYKLCSEQLSQQNHYDFGMRAVKSVLVMAGSLKRANPDEREDITLITALRDSNVPKFLVDDLVLFQGILGDLFPGVELKAKEYFDIRTELNNVMSKKLLQYVDAIIVKVLQFYDTLCVRWGCMLVGPTGGGKTVILHSLAAVLENLWLQGLRSNLYQRVKSITMNPKAITADELYGGVNLSTMEWQDGLLGLAVRNAVVSTDGSRQWIICDGPVDAVWIENLNTVLDDNKMLCLANSERIKLTPEIHMIFEVQDLVQASPATVSRCGMVYVDPENLGWLPIFKTWVLKQKGIFLPIILDFLFDIQCKHFDNILNIGKRLGKYYIAQQTTSKICVYTTVMESILKEVKQTTAEELYPIIWKLFIWTSLWAIGSAFDDKSKIAFEKEVRTYLTELEFEEDEINYIVLPKDSIWSYKVNCVEDEWTNWSNLVEDFEYDSNDKYFDMMVSTKDSMKFGFIAETLFLKKYPVLFTGETGVGKSVLAASLMKKLMAKAFVPTVISFSAQTSSKKTQKMIETQLDKRKRTQLGPPIGKKALIFIDDINMTKPDTYESQPPIELLRQVVDFHGFYDRDKMFWKELIDVILTAACSPPGGGRNFMTPRFVRHFGLLSLPIPDEECLMSIFSAILGGFLNSFNTPIKMLSKSVVGASITLYTEIAKQLLPTPGKNHYIFNLRDLSKCVQGILQASNRIYFQADQILRLFYHESTRVYHDRLVSVEDKDYFKNLMYGICMKYFDKPVVLLTDTVLFGDFMSFGQPKEERVYNEIKEYPKLLSVLFDYIEDYNANEGKSLKMILFEDCVEHMVRLARILRSDRGNGLLIGVAGMGKQTLAFIASHINYYKCFRIELTKGYDKNAFSEDIRSLYRAVGVKNASVTFLFTENQIVEEEFLEDINCMLNSGDVPNLFEDDNFDKLLLDLRTTFAEELTRQNIIAPNEVYKFFLNVIRNNLHVVLTMSAIGDNFRRRCRMFPSLVNCCTIDWFVDWPGEALQAVAIQLLPKDTKNPDLPSKLARLGVFVHKTVEHESNLFLQETGRHYYTTPSSFLELIKLYEKLLLRRIATINTKKSRIFNGLKKILDTNDLVAKMQLELNKLSPKLEAQANLMKELIEKITIDTNNADKVKKSVGKDEAIAKEAAAAAQAIADDANRDLAIAMPALRAAEDALKSLNKNDINELKAFTTPPLLVQFVMEAVCILLRAKPNWASAKVVMADVNFLKRLMEYDKEHIPLSILKKLRKYIKNPDFNPQKIEKVSKVAKSVSLWVIAVEKFAHVYKDVEPKIAKRRGAEAELQEIMKDLKGKQMQLKAVEDQIKQLQVTLETKEAEFKAIQDNADLTAARLNRASRLTSALADEEVRWKQTVKVLDDEMYAVPGDVIMSSCCVSYLGAFTLEYRNKLLEIWLTECRSLDIPSSPTFSLVEILGDAYEIRMWNLFGLPRDNISTENAIYATRAVRWPLMIDPQGQANVWIRNCEKASLRVLKMKDEKLVKTLEISIREGYPVLIEDITESLDPTLYPILARDILLQDGQALIKLGDKLIAYNPNFRLFLTTKLSNPHYLPEICINVTLINFLVTPKGLEEQLLAIIVAIEQPESEKIRNDLIVKINKDKEQLVALEDKVLKLLSESKGNILDDEELVETLNDAKETSLITAARLIDTQKVEKSIILLREKYRNFATYGANLYVCIASLQNLDPMYQYNLKYFSQIFRSTMEEPHEPLDIEPRIRQLKDMSLLAIYRNISRGLFEKHKLVFSFMLATTVEKLRGIIAEEVYNLLIIDPPTLEMVDVPADVELSRMKYSKCAYMEKKLLPFKGLTSHLKKVMTIQIEDAIENISFVNNAQASVNLSYLTNFERLLLVRTLKEEIFMQFVFQYIKATIGGSFLEAGDSSQLKNVYADTRCDIPLIFVLSAGSDPMSAFLKFANEMKMLTKLFSISLGQGQGVIAENYIEKGIKQGYWIFLQNCHLATSWMAAMELIVRNITMGITPVHENFRLYMSSLPTKIFPISILQDSVKLTSELPKGIKANIQKTFSGLTREYFEQHTWTDKWRALVFSLALFHAVTLERKKFGAIGWNNAYDFAQTDIECGIAVLEIMLRNAEMFDIPWSAIKYIEGEITWGGRVTDFWDSRCLRTILATFITTKLLDNPFPYLNNHIYFDPKKKTLREYSIYLSQLPSIDDINIFGMNQNADVIFQLKEVDFFSIALLQIVSGAATGSGGGNDNEVVYTLLNKIKKTLTPQIKTTNINPKLLEKDRKGRQQSLTTVLTQEIDRFNFELRVVHVSLADLEKAIKGIVVMSEQLEDVFNCFLKNIVPKSWAKKSFLSIKPLANWVSDFEQRINFLEMWKIKAPLSYWLSGFYFPQAFLTGILQAHARKFLVPIDKLKFDFQTLKKVIRQNELYETFVKVDDKDQAYGDIKVPDIGLNCHGMFIEGGSWDIEKGLVDAKLGELWARLPPVWFKPCLTVDSKGRYEAPLYKTQDRVGVLSTTGHSTNFILPVLLQSQEAGWYWILRGCALVTTVKENEF